jgi:hypothetical protein
MATLSVRSRSFDVRSSMEFRSTMRVERTRANRRERPPRIDKLGVTGSSPVPPIEKSSKDGTSVVSFGDESVSWQGFTYRNVR